MKVCGVHQFKSLDPPDIRELSNGDSDREHRRLKMIKGFMSWAYFKEYNRWTQSNNEEKIIVKRQVSYCRFLGVFGVFTNATVYFAFMTGIYNYRTRELLNMRKVPILVKFAVSSAISLYMCHKLYEKQIYEPELYRLAIKYRAQYDKEFQKKVENASELF